MFKKLSLLDYGISACTMSLWQCAVLLAILIQTLVSDSFHTHWNKWSYCILLFSLNMYLFPLPESCQISTPCIAKDEGYILYVLCHLKWQINTCTYTNMNTPSTILLNTSGFYMSIFHKYLTQGGAVCTSWLSLLAVSRAVTCEGKPSDHGTQPDVKPQFLLTLDRFDDLLKDEEHEILEILLTLDGLKNNQNIHRFMLFQISMSYLLGLKKKD